MPVLAERSTLRPERDTMKRPTRDQFPPIPETESRKTMTETAHEYAASIVDRLQKLDSFYRDVIASDGNPELWEPETRRYFDDELDGEMPEHIGSAWCDQALDQWTVLKQRWGQPLELAEVRLLITAGGPHAEIAFTHDDALTVEVWWGSDHAVRRIYCDPVSEWLGTVAELVDDAWNR